MHIETLAKIKEAVERVEASGHGQIIIEVVKGKVVLIKRTELEQIHDS